MDQYIIFMLHIYNMTIVIGIGIVEGSTFIYNIDGKKALDRTHSLTTLPHHERRTIYNIIAPVPQWDEIIF